MTSERQTVYQHYYLCDVETLLNNRYTNGINTRGLWVMPETKSTKRKREAVPLEDIEGAEEQSAQNPAKKPRGKPTKYDEALMTEILTRIAEGEYLRAICREDGMPAWRTIYDWLERDEELSARFARARDMGSDAIFEDTLIIADNPHYGVKSVESDKGAYVTTEDMLGHRKLQIETRFKMLSKFNPKKYGDRQILAGDADNPVAVKDVTLFDELVKNLELTRQKSKG